MSGNISIGLDYSHNNMLTLEASSYADFTQFLFSSAYKIGKIEAGFYTLEKINDYNGIIMSTPRNIDLKPKEIEIIENYVRNGGNVLIIGARGGDYLNRTNLNELTQEFGFRFAFDEIFDSVTYVNLQKRPILSKFKSHYITDNIQKIVLSSSCSLETLDIVEDKKNIKVDILIHGGINCWRNIFNGKDWIEEDCPKIPLMIATEYFKGKVVAFGTISIFSSLGREYGFTAFDNDILIANILRWLTTDIESEGKVITIDLQKDLFHWAESLLKEKNWENHSDIINVSLKYFKDNYDEIIKDLEAIQEERLERRKLKETAKEEPKEEEVIDLIPSRKKEDLEEIITAIEEVAGEKFERSITLEEETEEELKEELLSQLPEDLNNLTVKELKAFCKENEIDLPHNARKADIIKVIKYVLGID
jgi:Arc/MetJ-type ribon-helix-helix transcriptional regulator